MSYRLVGELRKGREKKEMKESVRTSEILSELVKYLSRMVYSSEEGRRNEGIRNIDLMELVSYYFFPTLREL